MDQFKLGMQVGEIKAWCEAAKNEAKEMSLSAPFKPDEYEIILPYMKEHAERNSLASCFVFPAAMPLFSALISLCRVKSTSIASAIDSAVWTARLKSLHRILTRPFENSSDNHWATASA